jgi:hypothetical protein
VVVVRVSGAEFRTSRRHAPRVSVTETQAGGGVGWSVGAAGVCGSQILLVAVPLASPCTHGASQLREQADAHAEQSS